MARLGRGGFLAIAVVFHLVYIYSIFDIYFVSPVVHGMRSFKVEGSSGPSAPAKRLVLFVGDGLRADKTFQSFPDPAPWAENSTDSLTPRPLAPFLRSRVLSHGTFGVSHTRVPTESRPGHVALIAGLYEDVSAVMTGWTHNPVNFDSVFNQSTHTWSWGSEDILPMFQDGAVPGRVDADYYSGKLEDWSKDGKELDTWVFNRVKAMFKKAESDKSLNQQLNEGGNVFFLHLLGLDSTGHTKRPYSKDYLHNIQTVDQGVKEVVEAVEKFYGDDKTAFVFTADHGMSDWGSHGDGHPDNTRTPLIVWGSGVAKPVMARSGTVAAGHEDGFSSDWNLDHIRRNDVAQADIAALMAYLVGVPYPANSVGELPIAYLAAETSKKAQALLVNAQEILEMYRIKEEKKRSTTLRFVPYHPLSVDGQSPDNQVLAIQKLIDAGTPEKAIAQTNELINIALEGLRYLQTYDWLFLRTLVTLGYLGWIVFAFTTVVNLHVLHGKAKEKRSTFSLIAFSSIFVMLYSYLWVQQARFTYFGYAIFPVLFWEEIFASRQALFQGTKILLQNVRTTQSALLLFIQTAAFIGIIEALVVSYFKREVYTICYCVASLWPLTNGSAFMLKNKLLVAQWILCCLVMSGFTILPVVKVESISLILIAGGLMFGVGVLYLLFEKSIMAEVQPKNKASNSLASDWLSRTVLGVQLGLIALAMVVTHSSVTSLQAGKGLPLGAQIVGWVVMVLSLFVPFLHGLRPNSNYLHRLLVIFLTFAPTFIILTISYEGMFYLAFCMTLLTWVRMEHKMHTHETGATPPASIVETLNPLKPAATAAKERLQSLAKGDYRSLNLTDFRIALFFLFFIQSGFFSTGNIASISSFSLEAVLRLIPVFDPFSQGALLLLKLMIPFAVISANLAILNRRIGAAPSALFMIVMAISDILTLNFFYMVRDEGSWLEIGTTISHFFIASLLGVFVVGLELVGEVFIGGLELSSAGPSVSPRKAIAHSNGTATSFARQNGDIDKKANGQRMNGSGEGGIKRKPVQGSSSKK